MSPKHEDHLNAFQLSLVCMILLAAFALVGGMDYREALEAENARLKARAAHCKAISAEAEAERIAGHVAQASSLRLLKPAGALKDTGPAGHKTPALQVAPTRGSDLAAALPGGQP